MFGRFVVLLHGGLVNLHMFDPRSTPCPKSTRWCGSIFGAMATRRCRDLRATGAAMTSPRRPMPRALIEWWLVVSPSVGR